MLVFGGTIIAWAILHDIHLARVEVRHFSEFHRPLLPLVHPALLAVQYALVATTGPGLVFGALAFVACRRGPRTKRRLLTAWLAFLPALAAIEALSLAAGSVARDRFLTNRPMPYPDHLYPEHSVGIAYTQSANLTAYLSALVLGAAYLILMRFSRRRLD